MASWTGNQTTFEDAWQLWEDVEHAEGATVSVRIHRPRQMQGGRTYPAQVSVTAVRREGKAEKERTCHCAIGGARGARTVPAAMVRALTELASRLEEARAQAVTQAGF